MGGGGLVNQAYSAYLDRSRRLRRSNQSGYYATVTSAAATTTKSATSSMACRSIVRSITMLRARLLHSETPKSQVYTGANPATSEGQGLAGFINQVIKTGTYPGYATGSLGIGTPTFYHRAAIEAGGSTPDRLFSYYFGVSGSNQAFNYVNNNNGSEYDNWLGPPLGIMRNLCRSVCTRLVGLLWLYGKHLLSARYLPATTPTFQRFTRVTSSPTFTSGIPHHHDAGRDDVQLLYTDEALKNQFYISATTSHRRSARVRQRSPARSSAPTRSTAALISSVLQHLYLGMRKRRRAHVQRRSSQCADELHAALRISKRRRRRVTGESERRCREATRDNSYNDTAIVKIQYTKNFGSSAYFRIYGFTFYSDWFLNGAYSTSFCDFVCPRRRTTSSTRTRAA